MSIVAVKKYKDKIVIGADSIVVRYGTQDKRKDAKLFRVDEDLIIGGSGFVKNLVLLKLFSQNHKIKTCDEDGIIEWFSEFQEWALKKDKSFSQDKTEFLVVFKNKVFDFFNYNVREVKKYEAIGAGMDYALTALYLEKSVAEAIEVSCELSIYCEKPINIIEVKI